MIFYFSGTGNSRYVAERLGVLLDQQAVSISDVMNAGKGAAAAGDSAGDALTGIVAPVYFFGLPTIVNDFVSNYNINSEKVFTVLTYGGVSANASGMLRKALSKKGIEVTHSFEIRMPDNYVVKYPVPDKGVQEKLLADAEKATDRIPELLKKDKHLKKSTFPGKMISSLAYWTYIRGRSTSEFTVSKKCTGCGRCENICPISVIKINGSVPARGQEKCIRCMACVHRCPEAAINIGKSRKNGRYVNPNVKFDDL